MGLAAPYTGEDEVSACADQFEPAADIDDAAEALFLGYLSGLIEAVWQAQNSGVARNRLAERLVAAVGPGGANVQVAPNIAELLTWIGSRANHLRQELRIVADAPTDNERLATDGEAHNWPDLGPVH
jgi:hypothetical protein